MTDQPRDLQPLASLPDDVVERLRAAVDESFEDTVSTLSELVSHAGIAWDSMDRAPLEASAEAVAQLLRDQDIDPVDIVVESRGDGRPGGPAILAEAAGSEQAPRVLLYAHHDVQPVGDRDEWETEPFEATRRGDRLYGRGAADDKAGIMVHVAALAALRRAVPEADVSVRFFIEGEEEAGSPTFRTLLENHRDRLEAEAIVVADSANWAVGEPALTTSLRGMVDGTITVRVLEHAVHSGMFGGPVLDAVVLLSRLLATLHDDAGRVAVPGLAPKIHSEVEMDEAAFRRDAGVLDGVMLPAATELADRLWNEAALSVIGMDVPSVAESSNVLLPVARAKFSLRLGPGMDPETAFEALQSHLSHQSSLVRGALVEVELGEVGQPFATDTKAPAAQAMLASLEDSWQVAPRETGLGGSIPFTADLAEVFPDAAILVTGVEDPDSRAHAPNESLHLEDFRHAILAEALWLARLGLAGNDSHADVVDD
ncbi:MAG: M20/M25/M40 family metallo-hydrolase [Micrococcus sp.]|nr:M20/M25/M40 family metallo-hydrolase [Micrococcus sp.]